MAIWQAFHPFSLFKYLTLCSQWSQVYSADMYTTVFEQDPMSAKAGKLYRDKVLYPGGSRDAMDTLKDFLGRKPNNEAFMKKLFAGAKKEA